MDKHVAAPALSRRQLLVATAAAAVVSVVLVPSAEAAPAEVEEALAKLTGGAAAKTGRINLEIAEVAENGGSVPFTVSAESPMTEQDFVKAIHVMADGNPQVGVATFNFTPAAGKAQASLRLRLAKTQKVYAAAVMSDGSVYRVQKEVKVTVGGCGG